ncbi:MAG: hypothetical protein FVQ82_07515 [Planctomycetes bacterium]|nr:hypothetical protein [Planctomycetota bacterium]
MQNDSEKVGSIHPESIKTDFPFTKKELIYPIKFTDLESNEISIPESEVKKTSISAFSTVGAAYNKNDWKVVSIAGFTPIPYKVITITAGVFRIEFWIFCIASALSRSARFFLVASLFRWKGEAIKPFIDKYFNWLSLAFVILLIGGFAALNLLH